MAPEPPSQSRSPRRAAGLAFIASGAVPLLALCGAPPDPMLLIYSVFVGAWVLRRRVSIFPPGRFAVGRLPGPVWLRYFMLMVLVGFLTETLAWAGNYLARAEQPALLHPQLLYDLLLSPGIYAAWALGWIVLTRRWRFSLTDVFIIQGVYGVFIEQQGAVFLKGLAVMPLGLVLWLYVFVVYGSAAGLAYLPVRARPRAAAGAHVALEGSGGAGGSIRDDGGRRDWLDLVLRGAWDRRPGCEADLAVALLVSPQLCLRDYLPRQIASVPAGLGQRRPGRERRA